MPPSPFSPFPYSWEKFNTFCTGKLEQGSETVTPWDTYICLVMATAWRFKLCSSKEHLALIANALSSILLKLLDTGNQLNYKKMHCHEPLSSRLVPCARSQDADVIVASSSKTTYRRWQYFFLLCCCAAARQWRSSRRNISIYFPLKIEAL